MSLFKCFNCERNYCRCRTHYVTGDGREFCGYCRRRVLEAMTEEEKKKVKTK